MAWLIALGGFACAIVGVLLVETILSRVEAAALRDAANAVDGWPIAVFRFHPRRRIVMLHRESESECAFVLVEGETVSAISAQDIWRLFNRGQLRWYRLGMHPLGMRQFLWYRDAHPEAVRTATVLDQPAPRWMLVAFGLLFVLMATGIVFVLWMDFHR